MITVNTYQYVLLAIGGIVKLQKQALSIQMDRAYLYFAFICDLSDLLLNIWFLSKKELNEL